MIIIMMTAVIASRGDGPGMMIGPTIAADPVDAAVTTITTEKMATAGRWNTVIDTTDGGTNVSVREADRRSGTTGSPDIRCGTSRGSGGRSEALQMAECEGRLLNS